MCGLKKIDDNKLDNITGGADTISGTVIRAFVEVIELFVDAGRGVGSAIRRVAEGNICPLK